MLRRSPGLQAGPPGCVRASLAITERNGPCRSLFARLGFEREQDEEGLQMWALQSVDALPTTDGDIYDVQTTA